MSFSAIEAELDQTNKVAAFFHGYAADFDSIYGHTGKRGWFGRLIDRTLRKSMRMRFEETVRLTARPEIKTILDIGCGSGRYCEVFLGQDKKVVGIDVAPGMLALAQQRTGNSPMVRYIKGDYLHYDFNEKFDMACLMGFFDYIERPVEIFQKLKKDIRTEILASFPRSSGILAWQRRIRYSARNCPLYLYSKDQIEDMLQKAGLRNYDIKPFDREYYVRVCLP